MKTGPLAVRLGNTLFRIEEINWLKIQRLTLWEKLANVALILSGLFFIYIMAQAKGSMWNVESLLGLLPICLGLSTHGDCRLGSSGDTQDSYFGRSLGIDVNINDLIAPLKAWDPGFYELKATDKSYHYLINPRRISWVSPWFTVNLWPLWMSLLFYAYAWAVPRGYHVPEIPKIPDLHILQFPGPGGVGPVEGASWFCIVVGVAALLASAKQGVVLGAMGGVADTLHLWNVDRETLFNLVAGASTDLPQSAPAAVASAKQPLPQATQNVPRE